MSRLLPIVPLLCAFFVCGGASAQDAQRRAVPDAEKGAVLSQRWCASCHIVSSRQTGGSDGTPSFSSIARKANFDAGKLALFLLDPHPIMPRMALTRDEARDIAAYIARQR